MGGVRKQIECFDVLEAVAGLRESFHVAGECGRIARQVYHPRGFQADDARHRFGRDPRPGRIEQQRVRPLETAALQVTFNRKMLDVRRGAIGRRIGFEIARARAVALHRHNLRVSPGCERNGEQAYAGIQLRHRAGRNLCEHLRHELCQQMTIALKERLHVMGHRDRRVGHWNQVADVWRPVRHRHVPLLMIDEQQPRNAINRIDEVRSAGRRRQFQQHRPLGRGGIL